MAFERRQYSGNAAATTLSSGINSSVTSIAIVDATGWPDGSVGPFWVTVDRGLSNEERVKITSRTGTTLTVAASGRGADGTTAAAHSAGAAIEHTLSKTDLDEANDHYATTTYDHHTQYMKADGTRHDLTARHGSAVVDHGSIGGLTDDDHTQYMLADGTRHDLTARHGTAVIADAAITTAKIADANVTQAKLANDSVGAAQLIADSVGTSEIATDAVTAAEIAAGAVGEAELAADAVATAKIQDNAVTGPKIAAGSVGPSQIGAASLTAALIAAEAFSTRTPTATNLTLGTGGINTQLYHQVGKRMYVSGMIVLGTSGALTGTLSVDVPTAARTLASMAWVGSARYQDTGSQYYVGTCDIASAGTTIAFRHSEAANNGSVGASGPFAFAGGDTIHYSLVYEVA